MSTVMSYTVHVFKIDAEIWNNIRLRCSFAASQKAYSENWMASYENRKVSSEDVEGFFQRVLALYIPKFPKNGVASLTDIPGLCLGLP